MHTFADKLLLSLDVPYISIGDFSVIGMQAWYPGIMRGQQAVATYDWGLLVVLIAVELGKQHLLISLATQSPQGYSDPWCLKDA